MCYRITDQAQIDESLCKVVNYSIDDERRHFEEEFIDVFDGFAQLITLEDIGKAIKQIRKIKNGTNHILYHMLVLKSAYYEIFEEFEEDK